MEVANVASSSSDSMKPTFQHHHGDGTSFLRGSALPPIVRNSSVVLITLISFSSYFISIAYFTAGVNGARLEGLLSFGRSLADGLARSCVTEKQYRRTTYQNIFVLFFVLHTSFFNLFAGDNNTRWDKMLLLL